MFTDHGEVELDKKLPGIIAACSSLVDKRGLRHEDLCELSNVFSPEFNNGDLHDRILVFQIESENDHSPSEPCTSHRVVEKEKQANDVLEGIVRKTNEASSSQSSECKMSEANVCVDNNLKTQISQQSSKHKLFVHSCLLAVQSPYFRALFYSSQMKESHSNKVVMKVTEDELEAHLTLIEAMYRIDVLNDKDYTLVLQVLVLADKYNVCSVFKKCKYVLMAIQMTLEICECILKQVTNVPKCDDLREDLKDFLAKEFSPLDQTWTTDKFTRLSEVAMNILLSSDKLAVASENTVFVALMKWLKVKESKNLPVVSKQSLLHLVRFKLMNSNFLCDVVKNHHLAKEIDGFNELLQNGLAYHTYSQQRKEVLKEKPVSRTSFEDNNNPTFVLVIDKNSREKLLDDKCIVSDSFWCKGYEMISTLEYNAQTVQLAFSLYLMNIPYSNAYVHINCIARFELFTSKYSSRNPCVYFDYKYTGSKDGLGQCSSKCTKLESISDDKSHTMEIRVKILD